LFNNNSIVMRSIAGIVLVSAASDSVDDIVFTWIEENDSAGLPHNIIRRAN
jgi:hypothetical protein